jgi:hypothetical protein
MGHAMINTTASDFATKPRLLSATDDQYPDGWEFWWGPLPRKSPAVRPLPPKILAARLGYAKIGWQTFPAPADGSKKSMKWKAKYGTRWGCTTDEQIIRKEFKSRKFKGQNIGIVTGAISGIFVIETDTAEHNGADGATALKNWEAVNGALPRTLMARSPSGSVHYYFKHPGEGIKVKNSAGAICPGVDVRGDGGMAIGSPSYRPPKPGKAGGTYEWINAGHHIAYAPQALLDLVIEQPQPEAQTISRPAPEARNGFQLFNENTRGGGWAKAALRAECEILRGTPDGSLNQQLNNSAFNLGQIVGGGGLTENEVVEALTRAAKDVKLDCENDKVTAKATKTCKATINSGISKGKLKPRTAPDLVNAPPAKNGVALSDFYSNMQTHSYIYVPTREMWPSSSVNSRIPPVQLLKKNGHPVLDEDGEKVLIKASTWLDQNRPVEQMTWAPGLPPTIPDRLISEGGWITHDGVTTFNLYRPPTIKLGDAKKAKRWVDLVKKVYPGEDTEEILNFCAHRRQKPDEKINHALVLGGDPGIGKDSILEGLKQAIGPWNCKEISPQDLMGQYNDYMQSTALRVSEARDLGDVNRFTLYDHMKTVTATPPDVSRVNAKYVPQHYVLNVCGVIITTNYKTNGLYLPPDDRRHYVAWSELQQTDFPEGFWIEFWDWYQNQNGFAHVAAYLAERDISTFDAKRPPNKTAAFWAIVDANASPEEGELADVLDRIAAREKRPVNATTLINIINHADGLFQDWLEDRKNRRAIPHRFEKCGYVPVRSSTTDGLWVIKGKRQVVYARAELSSKDQFRAAQKLASGDR